jgi:quercetin dioxygenase-like cupin family protein
MDGMPVEMEGAEQVKMRLLLGRADGAPTFAMRHFEVAPGGHTPRHQHPYEHGVQVVGGTGTVEVGGEEHELKPGDSLFIPPDVLHQFRADRGESLQFMCMVPTTFDCGKPTPGS